MKTIPSYREFEEKPKYERGTLASSKKATIKRELNPIKQKTEMKKCPVSGLQITTKPEWKYKAKDGSCTLELVIIGNSIIYVTPIGLLNGESNKWYTKTVGKIIAKYFGDRKYYLAYDYSLLNNAALEAKQIFIHWLVSSVEKIELVTIFGMNQINKIRQEKLDKILKKMKEKGFVSVVEGMYFEPGSLYPKCPHCGALCGLDNFGRWICPAEGIVVGTATYKESQRIADVLYPVKVVDK